MTYNGFSGRFPASLREKVELNSNFSAGKRTTDFSFNMIYLYFFPIPVPVPAAERMSENPP